MALQGEQLRARPGVPQPRGVVKRAGQKARAVGAEGHARDSVRMALEGDIRARLASDSRAVLS